MSTFSCALLAELAVGRIMRARNESSGVFEDTLPTRERGLSEILAAGAKDAWEAALRIVELVCRRLAAGPFARGALLVVVVGPAARLPGRDAWASDFNFAADEAVAAVIEEGRRTGRVGDLGLPLVLPGEVFVDALPPLLCLESPEGWPLVL